MSIAVANLIWMVIGGYLAIGLVFALLFIVFGAPRIDPAAKGMPIRTRAIILPGSMLLWPLLLIKWLRGSQPSIT